MSTRLSPEEISEQIGAVDLVPQAIVKLSPQDITRRLGIAFDADADDLDAHVAAYFRDDRQVFALKRYDGEPADTVTIYLDQRLAPAEAGAAIERITRAFEFPADLIIWRETLDLRPRGDNSGAA